MPQIGLLDHLLDSDPNLPATNGAVMLLRAETKSEFKSLRTEIGAQFTNFRADVDKRFEQVDKRFEQVDKRFDQMDQRFDGIDERFARVERSLELVAGQILQLIERR